MELFVLFCLLSLFHFSNGKYAKQKLLPNLPIESINYMHDNHQKNSSTSMFSSSSCCIRSAIFLFNSSIELIATSCFFGPTSAFFVNDMHSSLVLSSTNLFLCRSVYSSFIVSHGLTFLQNISFHFIQKETPIQSFVEHRSFSAIARYSRINFNSLHICNPSAISLTSGCMSEREEISQLIVTNCSFRGCFTKKSPSFRNFMCTGSILDSITCPHFSNSIVPITTDIVSVDNCTFSEIQRKFIRLPNDVISHQIVNPQQNFSDIDFSNCDVAGGDVIDSSTCGGALFVDNGGKLVLYQCSFTNCSSSSHGGAVFCKNSEFFSVTGCNFTNCRVKKTTGDQTKNYCGGGCFISSSEVVFSKTNFEGCSSTHTSGALHISNSSRDGSSISDKEDVTVENCGFRNCSAESYVGGAVTVEWSTPSEKWLEAKQLWSNIYFENNTAKYMGGAIFCTLNELEDVPLSIMCALKSHTQTSSFKTSETQKQTKNTLSHPFSFCFFHNNSAGLHGNCVLLWDTAVSVEQSPFRISFSTSKDNVASHFIRRFQIEEKWIPLFTTLYVSQNDSLSSDALLCGLDSSEKLCQSLSFTVQQENSMDQFTVIVNDDTVYESNSIVIGKKQIVITSEENTRASVVVAFSLSSTIEHNSAFFVEDGSLEVNHISIIRNDTTASRDLSLFAVETVIPSSNVACLLLNDCEIKPVDNHSPSKSFNASFVKVVNGFVSFHEVSISNFYLLGFGLIDFFCNQTEYPNSNQDDRNFPFIEIDSSTFANITSSRSNVNMVMHCISEKSAPITTVISNSSFNCCLSAENIGTTALFENCIVNITNSAICGSKTSSLSSLAMQSLALSGVKSDSSIHRLQIGTTDPICQWDSSLFLLANCSTNIRNFTISNAVNGAITVSGGDAEISALHSSNNLISFPNYPSLQRNILCKDNASLIISSLYDNSSITDVDSLWILNKGCSIFRFNEEIISSYFFIPRIDEYENVTENWQDSNEIKILLKGKHLFPCNISCSVSVISNSSNEVRSTTELSTLSSVNETALSVSIPSSVIFFAERSDYIVATLFQWSGNPTEKHSTSSIVVKDSLPPIVDDDSAARLKKYLPLIISLCVCVPVVIAVVIIIICLVNRNKKRKMEEDLRKEKEEEEKRRMRQQREEDEAKLLAESRNKKEDEILVNNDIVEEFRDELVQEDAYVDISKLLNEISKGDADGHMLSTNWEDALSSDKSEAEELLRQLKIPDNY